MKKEILLTLATFALAADSFTDAITNGKFGGDIGGYFEQRHINSGQKSTYYNNTSWLVASLALGYESDFYKNLKFAIAARGTLPLYEGDKNYQTLHGKGDSTERIYENNEILLSKLYRIQR